MITKSSIQKILETVRVEEVVGEYVNLKKRGTNYIGLCPFHNERTPSFNVNPARNIFKCFGCGKGGDAVNFLMEHEHFSYPESLRFLAKKYSIALEETADKAELIEEKKIEDSLYIVNEFALQFFSKQLLETEEGKNIGLSYFQERGFRENTIKKFNLGYSPEKSDALLAEAKAKMYADEYLIKTGLIKQNESGVQRDFFRGRVMFPIHNVSGKVVGFGGRILKKDEKQPKYLNSPESEIYHKSKILFGIYHAKQSIRQHDECFLVEGYTDVVSLHQAGIENVVASSGTSLTVDQIKLIKRFTNNITIIYDGDAAGVKAALRGLELILEEDMNVRIVLLPDPEDPDSYVQKVGATAFREFIKTGSENFILFKTRTLLGEAANDPVKRAAVIHQVVDSIARIPDPIVRSEFIKECSALMNTAENILLTEVNKIKRNKFQKETGATKSDAEVLMNESGVTEKSEKQIAPTSNSDLYERKIIEVLIEFGNLKAGESSTVAGMIKNELADVQFSNHEYRVIFYYFSKLEETELIPDFNFFLHHESESIRQLTVNLMSTEYTLSDNWEKKHEIIVKDRKDNYLSDLESSIRNFKRRKYQEMMRDLSDELKLVDEPEAIRKLQNIQREMHKVLRDVTSGQTIILPRI